MQPFNPLDVPVAEIEHEKLKRSHTYYYMEIWIYRHFYVHVQMLCGCFSITKGIV